MQNQPHRDRVDAQLPSAAVCAAMRRRADVIEERLKSAQMPGVIAILTRQVEVVRQVAADIEAEEKLAEAWERARRARSGGGRGDSG